MSMRALLAVLDHHASNHPLLETASALTAAWKARLEVFLPYPLFGEPDLQAIADQTNANALQQVVEEARRQGTELVKAARREFEDCCRMHGVAISADYVGEQPFARWVAYADFDRGCRVARHAALADLILVQRPHADSGEGYEALIDKLLDGTGRPVMLVPPSGADAACRRIAIAWNGSAENVRAVAAALGLIGAAEAVDIITAESDRASGTAANKLASYLASHGIAAVPHVLARGDNRPVGEAILETCSAMESDLLVMGAYTHTRWQEKMFGGVTRHVMAHAGLPVLMAH